MPLDPQAREVLDAFAAMDFDGITELPPARARELFERARPPSPVEEVARVEDRRLPGPAGEIPVRLYAPEARGPLPALVYFHGGGFVIGSLDTHDHTCRSIANAARCAVVSVDYRLAPEHRFPAAPEDCYAATRHVAREAAGLGVDPTRMAVGGDSAGGNLAAVVALMARERGGPELVHQLLVYPVIDHAADTASYVENADGYLLTAGMMRWFWAHYLGDPPSSGRDPLASPLRAPDLSGLPPAHVITAEFDPLRDEGEAYAARLRDAGVPTVLRRYDGMIHGFLGMPDALDAARTALAEAVAELEKAFGAPR